MSIPVRTDEKRFWQTVDVTILIGCNWRLFVFTVVRLLAHSWTSSMPQQYKVQTVSIKDISATVIDSMASLYLDNYDGSNQATFRKDLAAKDEAILLWHLGELVGFTTLRVFVTRWQGRDLRFVYSGDTIVAPHHWGQSQLSFAWIARIGEIKGLRPELPLYWFLLVKGHRTFRYLPVFGRSFYPHWEHNRDDLKPLADHLAKSMFGADYNPATGVVEFERSRGHLKTKIARPSSGELEKAATQFFLARNPGYLKGHELVCLCELELFNMKPLTSRIFQRALLEPVGA